MIGQVESLACFSKLPGSTKSVAIAVEIRRQPWRRRRRRRPPVVGGRGISPPSASVTKVARNVEFGTEEAANVRLFLKMRGSPSAKQHTRRRRRSVEDFCACGAISLSSSFLALSFSSFLALSLSLTESITKGTIFFYIYGARFAPAQAWRSLAEDPVAFPSSRCRIGVAAGEEETPFLVGSTGGGGGESCSMAATATAAAIEMQEEGKKKNPHVVADDTESSDATAHQISNDPWSQVGFVLTTGMNSAYVLGYSGSIMVPLGWIGGTVGLLAAAAISFYANVLIARLHEIGGRRHIRYRDLAGYVYGRKMYSLTWALQYVNLFMINTGFIILAGQALKGAYVLYRDDGLLKLPYCIAIAGFVCALFAFGIPHLSALRIWLGFSTIFSLVYIVVAFVLSLTDGVTEPRRDYSIPGTHLSKIFSTIGAVANLVFAYNTGMLPEIQATVKPPAVGNMVKALAFQFTAGVLPLYAVTFMGYWAYGSSTSSFLLNSVKGPIWLKTFANITAFLQTVIALHIFASPMYEYLDTRYGSGKGHAFSLQNLSFRVMVRGGYLTVNTLVAALLPFLGDFMSLTGALSTFPLTFVLANHMYLCVKQKDLSALQRAWHWLNVVGFGCLAVAAAVAALRLIAVDSRTYHLFADL